MHEAYRGFPTDWLKLVRCHQAQCEGALHAGEEAPPHILQGHVDCLRCAHRYPIEAGILRLLNPVALHGESDNERRTRDRQALDIDHSWEDTPWVKMELVPTLKASAPLAQAQVLELGAGTGRYSVRMAERGARLLATDFSFTSLRVLAERVKPGWEVALVEADCTRLRLAPGRFDLVASTLMSNLPAPDHREAVYQLAASALREGGKFVFSTHHHSWRARWRGEAQAGHYRSGGIYRYLFRQGEIRRETRRFFGSVDCRPMQIHVPLSAKLRVQYVASRMAERIWPLNRLGDLLLVAARKPYRAAAAFLVSHAHWLSEWTPLLEAVGSAC